YARSRRLAGGKLSTRGNPMVAALFVYNPAGDTWARKRDMPAAGHEGITGAIKGKLYVVTNTSAGSRFFRYDPATDTWKTLAPTDYPRPWSAAGCTSSAGILGNGKRS